MYEIRSSSVIRASVETIWAVITDVANWPSWDPHEQAARLDGPLFRLYFGRKMRKDMRKTWTALESRVA